MVVNILSGLIEIWLTTSTVLGLKVGSSLLVEGASSGRREVFGSETGVEVGVASLEEGREREGGREGR